jgi:nitrite reductase/ring-hydroxylating ferredoxin subunit
MSSETDQTRAARLGPYSAYYNRPAAFEASHLAEVGPGTPGGEYLRRYWHPIMLESELKDLPVSLRILAEDLVIFRDGSGDVGLLHRACAHRGASLEFGIVQEHGIMCCYHGWHFGVDGTLIAAGAEPAANLGRLSFCQGAYPVTVRHGMIFAYMGPPDEMPVFPEFDSFTHPVGNQLIPIKMTLPCNWLQVVENACDPIHNAYLHAISSGAQFSPAFAVLPALDFVETPLGFLSMATRRIGDNVFIRASDIILPNVAQFASGQNPGEAECFNIACSFTRWVVPIDNEHCYYTGLVHSNARTQEIVNIDRSLYGVDKMNFIGQTADRPYDERQRQPGDYDALASQGAIANRKNEHLGTTDRGIVLFRRMLGRAIEAVRIGEVPAIPLLYKDGPVRTYNHELVFRLPSQSNIGDMATLGEFGRRAAQIVVDTDDLPCIEREAVAGERIRRLLAEDLVA